MGRIAVGPGIRRVSQRMTEYNPASSGEGEPRVRVRAGRVEEELIAANAENVYRVAKDALPLHCPLPGMYLWNSHPKVFLPIEATGEAKCPYCSSVYELQADTPQ